MGADISMLGRIEDAGGLFRDNGVPRDALAILENHGLNFFRLRTWHSPQDGCNDLQSTARMARRIKTGGSGFLLDIHYSDTWADPGHQEKPAAWDSLGFQALKDSVYRYTRDTMTYLKHRDALPDIVQIGNEITCGTLWNDGRVCGGYDTPRQWARFAELLDEAIRGIREGLDSSDAVEIMIHIDRGADTTGSRRFFDNILARGIDFDIVGLSYYPWWHGSMQTLRANVDDLAERYGKEIVLVETAYPWTLGWNDLTHNIVGDSSQLHTGYPASPAGQKAFLADLIDVMRDVPGGKGGGLFYWAPEYISAPRLGSPWENLALFDFTGELLRSIDAFDSTRGAPER